jgi:transcriptional regulator with XRE-family HTH domain
MRYQKTEWGIKVMNFAQRYGMTLKDLANASEVSYNTLLQVRIGKTPGEKAAIVEKVEAFMESYAATADPTANAALRPFEEVSTCLPVLSNPN